MVVGALMVRFGPGPGPNQEVWHDPDALPSMTHSGRRRATVAPVGARAGAPARPSRPAPVAHVAPVAAPVAVAPVAGAVEVETPAAGHRDQRARARRGAGGGRGGAGGARRVPPAGPSRCGRRRWRRRARAGADDLKRIKGVGPKLEELLHSLGIYPFHQIAAWGPAEVAWMDSNLEGFFGRVTRDDWVGQAKLLAAGGETEFSQRVDEGEVY